MLPFFLIVWRETINQSSGVCGAYEQVAVQGNFSSLLGFKTLGILDQQMLLMF